MKPMDLAGAMTKNSIVALDWCNTASKGPPFKTRK